MLECLSCIESVAHIYQQIQTNVIPNYKQIIESQLKWKL